jgi:hypothetical protein
MTHEVKTRQEYFEAARRGDKTFTIRKDDRVPQYAVGDWLHKREIDTEWHYTGRELFAFIAYKLTGVDGLADGYCLLVVRDVQEL